MLLFSSYMKLSIKLLILILCLTSIDSIQRKAALHSDVIEEVDSKKLEQLLDDTEYIAVFFYTRSCENCKQILEELEKIDDDADRYGVGFVKTYERGAAKKHGITSFPTLVYFRNKEPTIYEGDLMNEDQVLEWLTSVESMDLPDKIEEVNAKILQNYIDDHDFVAVLFYKDNCKKCEKVLHHLEEIDDDADQKNIGFIKIADEGLAYEYGLDDLPSLVYYRRKIPIVYNGDLEEENKVLEWLIEFRDTADDPEDSNDDEIEDVSANVLTSLIENSECLTVLFYDDNDKESLAVLKELENIDDELDQQNIAFVKIDDTEVAKRFGIDSDEIPQLVYFEKKLPNFYQGDLKKEEEVLEWIIHQKSADEIEDITDVVLDQMIDTAKFLAVLFYDRDDPKSMEVLKELENIDDECDEKGIFFVKIDDDSLAREYGIDDELPTLVYFENKIPSVYMGDLKNEEKVLEWLIRQMTSDEIEEVSTEMLDFLTDKHPHLAVLLYKANDKQSDKILKELEHIDDDCDRNGIVFVKTDDPEAAAKYGVKKLPVVLFFENEMPTQYEGDLMNEEKLLQWLIDQQANEEIEDVNPKTLKSLIETSESLAVLFYDADSPKSASILKELEEIDDDTDKYDIPFVKIDDDTVAKEYGLDDELPILVYFENRLPTVYENDLHDEEKVLEWLIKQKVEDTVEEVTEEILEDLIREREYVLVFFAPNNCKECDDILHKCLETIDDDTDEHGILLVTTDDVSFAKKQTKVTKFPSLILFRNGEPVIYKGDLKKPEAILKWVTSEEALDKPDQIEEVNFKMLERMLEKSPYVAVLFNKEKCSECEKVLVELENIDHIAEQNDIDFVKVKDPAIAKEYNIITFPSLIFFRKRFPQFYVGNLRDEDTVLKWLIDNKVAKEDVIELVDRKMLDVLLDDVDFIAVFFYDPRECSNCDKILKELENIDDDTDKIGMHFVKTEDVEYAKEIGITHLPALVYFEDNTPSIYDGNLLEEEEVLEWLIKQKNEDTIENINRDILFRMIAEKEYLAVLFYQTDDESDEVIEHLERIDDDCGEYDVHLVKISDNLIAKKYGIRTVPGLVYFRRGKHIKFDGDLFDEDEVLEYLTKPENMDLSDAIEKVNKRMFERLLGKVTYLAVLFYSKTECKQCDKVLEELEKIDDDADSAGIKFVKIEDSQLAKKYGVFALPALIFFKKGEEDEPIIYAGDLKKGDKILDWLINQKDPSLDKIEEVDGPALRKLIENSEHLAVYFYDQEVCQKCTKGSYKADCSECKAVLDDLENIDSDTDRHGIIFVKTAEETIAHEYGIRSLPALIYFEKQIPSIFDGDMSAEEDVLQWLVQQKTEDTIESVNRELLEQLVETTHYLVVFFYKPHCRACDVVLEELENIDDDCEVYGINFVKIQDVPLAKRYGIKTYPALIYFRNGNPLIFDGDLRNEDAVLEWLIDDDNRELADEIEDVNARMLEKLIDESPFLAVLFYDDQCDECDEVLKELENIDDDADLYGIDFVKVNDAEACHKYNVHTLPTLAYFRKQTPILYDGDLLEEEKVLKWLTSNDVFELKDEIEEVNRKMLDKLLGENDFVAVYFYEKDCYDCEEVLKELEHIDDDADDLDIMFVKIKDMRYARKYGIIQAPALVYFRRKFPAIYRGDLMKEEDVLEWLKKNRYRHPELNIFMYGLTAITGAFIFYTLFLMFCIKATKDKKE